jgi:hypothetical protein
MSEANFWLISPGKFLDMWTCHKQWLGIEKSIEKELTLDDIL